LIAFVISRILLTDLLNASINKEFRYKVLAMLELMVLRLMNTQCQHLIKT